MNKKAQINMNMIIIGIISLIIIVIISVIFIGRLDLEFEQPEYEKDILTPGKSASIDYIDCENNVICYDNNIGLNAWSCTYVPDIAECN